MSKGLRWVLPVYLLLWALPVMAQGTYGTGEAAFVPQTNPSTITIDGVMGAGEPWGEALVLDATQRWTGGYYDPPGIGITPDIEALARVLYANDTLYVFYRYEDYELYIEPDEPFRLRAGDCCYFDARAGHAAISVGPGEALIMSVVSAPLVRPADADDETREDSLRAPVVARIGR